MPICTKCNAIFPMRAEIDGLVRNLQRRKFCLSCSPYGLHNTRDLTQSLEKDKHCCPRCKQLLDLSEFYTRRKRKTPSVYCKTCSNDQVIERQQKLKRLAVDYKGGHCVRCGYDRYIGSLEFHHLDPSKKEFTLSHIRHTTFEKIKPELDKCLLLCSNCHREEHARIKGLFYPQED